MSGTQPASVLDVALHFALLSLLSVGGITAVLPEMHREAVEIRGWVSESGFADLFGVAQASPGPNMLIVTVLGYHVAGLAGGLAATAAMCVPTSLLTYMALSAWDRFKARPWRAAVQDGLTPVMVGLVSASAFLLARAADTGIGALAITLGTAAVALFTRVNPVWPMAAGAVLGVAGLV